MSLSERSDEEISSLLTEYGIKHGPIVDSTRRLYEKKLEKAMEEEAPVKPSSDKTYYREEEEEVTYITYHNPVRHEGSANVLKQRVNAEPDEDEESEEEEEVDPEPPVQVTYRASNQRAVQSRGPTTKKSGGGMWRVLRMLLLFAVLAAVFYYAFCRVMNDGDNPFGVE